MKDFGNIPEVCSKQNCPPNSLKVVNKHELAHATQGLQKPWKPLSFSSGILVSFALFTAGLAAMLGVFQWQNSRNGALLLAGTGDSFSAVDAFLYRFCPTIIVVFYSIAWSWIDLDVKRLEPWFQLAQPGGSSARASLLSHYPVDFLPLVPFKAAQRRQWTIWSASTITVLVAWALIPLQNGIFANNFVTVPRVVNVATSTSLLSLADQSSKLGMSILHDGFSILWLGQSMPAFTTAKYAIAPFKVSGAQKLLGSNQTLSAPTTMYGTDLECKPPAHVQINDGQLTFDDGDGCVATNLMEYTGAAASLRYQSYYIGYYNDANSDFALQLAGCPLKSSHLFLAIWKVASISPPDFHNPANATALFCKPSYYTQPVNATVSLPQYSVISTSPTGPRSPLSELTFNITQFEYLLSNGVPPPSVTLPARQDIIDLTVLRQDSKVQNLSLSVPITNMVGFAVGATHFAPEDYLNPAKLSDAFQSAHRLLFSLGIQNVFTPIDQSHVTTGLFSSTLQAVTIEPTFAFLSQASIAFIVVTTGLLVYLLSRRTGKLACDPDSLAQVMAMSDSQGLQRLFSRHDASDDKALASALAPIEFALEWQPGSYHPTVEVLSSKENIHLLETEKSTRLPHSGNSNNPPRTFVQPFEYSLLIGLPLCLGLIIMISSLILMHQKAIQDNGTEDLPRKNEKLTPLGLPLPSTNPTIQQVILNYIPTALATVLEPTWVMLTRLACMMRPLEELRSGNARAQRSLLLKYTSVPPPLVIFRAMKSRDLFLVILAFTTILANLLTVSLSGLFSQGQVYQGRSTTLQPLQVPRFLAINASDTNAEILSNYNQNDAFYVASANFTNQTSLPSWTSQHYYFLSFASNTSLSSESGLELKFQAPGFGADLECQEMTTMPSDEFYAMTFNANATLLSLVTSSVLSDGSIAQCTTYDSTSGPDSSKTYMSVNGDPQGPKALEIVAAMRPLPGTNATLAEQESCSSLILRGWVRADFSFLGEQEDASSNLSNDNSGTISSTFMSCRARPKVAMFTITISPSGQIIASTQISRATYNLPSSVNLTSALAATSNNLNNMEQATWHNDTAASDWSNYLVKTLTGSTAFLDARLPPPNFDTASTAVSETYSRLFAIQMSLQSAQLEPAPSESPPITGEVLTLERRVFMSETMFRISVAILGLDLVVAVLFYSRSRSPFLPRLPINIASQITYFAASHVVDDVREAGGDLSQLDKQGCRYGYGKYIGKDGRTHVGIERVPYVTKLATPGSWNLRRRRWWGSRGVEQSKFERGD